MAGIDSSIYLQQQAPSIFGSYVKGNEQGMRMAQLSREKKDAEDEQAFKDSVKSAYVQDPQTGKITLDQGRLAEIGKQDPLRMQAFQQDQRKAQAQQMHDNLDLASTYLTGVKDEQSYQQTRPKLLALGFDKSEVPDHYDPNYVKNIHDKTMSFKDQLAAQLEGKKVNAKIDENNVRREELGEQRTQKRVMAMKDDLDPNKARGGNLAKSQAMVNNADRVDALFKQFPDYNIPPQQTTELSTALAGLISGGSPQSQHQIDTLTPSSMQGDAAKIANWITGNPGGSQQQAFMKMMHETAIRERGVAEGQVKGAQIQRLAAYRDLKAKAPEDYQALLDSYGLTDEDFQKYGKGPKGPSASLGSNQPKQQPQQQASNQGAPSPLPAHPQDNDAVAWAKANPQDPRAAKIFAVNGMTANASR